ncbi:GNAT family N-acetyltransferase [Kroppenstedtia eburnea]|uniref:Protein N-acetyltransferase, RimJ/RimL family n=1 Tax=Kroppenstedtia eburnea TaxID=714067 RepID=A0A1N7MH06_9BACL|nr:GNAT family protein [Kroppenstedtia eburnea]QKI81563.1 GNAT family N-acetyltransferase [Kroppenstedtia eburnea]SIS85310.1 Protein N-acetyltransferase, RimJ/RimL family [Kroppenstedtia eburnea]
MSEESTVIKLLEGERVYLRPPEKRDLGLFYQSFYNPMVRRLTGTYRVMSMDAMGSWLERVTHDESRLLLCIVDREDDRVVGDVELLEMDPVNRSAHIRIALRDEKEFGKGYGTEAMGLMLDHGFGCLNLHRIELEVFDYNHRAIRTYEKLGFRREGVRREALFYEGAYHDVIQMGLLAREYRKKK